MTTSLTSYRRSKQKSKSNNDIHTIIATEVTAAILSTSVHSSGSDIEEIQAISEQDHARSQECGQEEERGHSEQELKGTEDLRMEPHHHQHHQRKSMGEVGRQQLEEDEDPDSNEDEEATPMMSGVGRKEQNNRRSVVRCAGKGE